MYNLLDTPVVEILLSNGIIRQYNYIVGVVYLSGYGNILRYAIISTCGSLSCICLMLSLHMKFVVQKVNLNFNKIEIHYIPHYSNIIFFFFIES